MDAIIMRRNPHALSVVEPSFFEEIDRWARDVWDTWTPTLFPYRRTAIPMDMYGTKDGMVLKAELPGFRKEDVDVNLEGDRLIIKAVSKKEEIPEGSSSYLSERFYGEYSRSLTLPFPVDPEKVSATFENGLLQVSLPMSEEVKPKHIEIKVK
jgi:HSP20 family protein